jgi:glycosyltransferase involved in cell wall biosynthesis
MHLLIVGAKRDPAYANAMDAKARSLPGVLLIDTLPQDDLWALMCEAQAVLNTSKSESSPNSLLEAMALGVPVLARDIPGNRAVIQHGKTGFLFDSPDDFLASAMLLLEDGNLRNALVQEAKNIIDAEFAPAREASAYQALFKSIAS